MSWKEEVTRQHSMKTTNYIQLILTSFCITVPQFSIFLLYISMTNCCLEGCAQHQSQGDGGEDLQK